MKMKTENRAMKASCALFTAMAALVPFMVANAAYNVKEGDPVPVPDGTPGIPPDDEYYTYTFTGWNRDVDGVDFDHLNVGVELYPKFEATEK